MFRPGPNNLTKWDSKWQAEMRLSLRAARASVRSAHRHLVFGRALSHFARAPVAAIGGSQSVLTDLIYGWDNEGWSGGSEFLVDCVEGALSTHGAILECGSGLTTLLLGIVAQQRGISVWSLEHLPIWAERVQACLDRHRIESVRLHVAPLRPYGEYDWYAPPLEAMPREFALVVCDGPPGATKGGRHGLLPVMRERLSEGCLLLVDDAERDAEQAMVNRWAEEVSCQVSLHGEAKPYFKVRLHDRSLARDRAHGSAPELRLLGESGHSRV
jgi:Methyltransferase domain